LTFSDSFPTLQLMKPRIRVSENWPREVVCAGSKVTVYRRVKGDTYRVFEVTDFTSGRRQLRSFSDEGEALEEAKRLVALMAQGESQAAALRSPERAAYGRAISLLSGTGATLETACALFAESVKLLGSPALLVEAARLYTATHSRITARRVAEAVDQHIENKTRQGASRRYLDDLRHRLGRLAETFQCDVGDVTTPLLQTWLDDFRASPQTIRNYRTVLSGFFEFARARGWCAQNPAEGLVVPRVKSDLEPAIFTPDDLRKLLEAAEPDFVPCLVLGGLCGLRSAEVERIHWEDVDLENREVIIRRGTAKTRSRRIVPLCDAAVAWLSPYQGCSGPVWPRDHEQFYEAQRTTAEQAGITWKANGLRHGYASHRLAQTGDAVRVAHELGNSATVVHSFYKSLVSQAQGRAWFDVLPSGRLLVAG
jgi:integrase